MKRLTNIIGLCFIVVIGSSCSKEYDNYPEPAETLTGSVTDVTTGTPVQTEAGSNGTRIRMDELSYSDNPTPYYFYSMQDGSFNNTKIFKGQYRISVEGPFVPLLQYDVSGNITIDNRQTLEVQGNTNINFKVEPFLNVEWVGEPVYNSADSTITTNVKFTRGTSNAAFQLNVTDVFLFVNSNPYAGNNNYDNRYSNQISYSGTAGNTAIGSTVTISTKDHLPGKRTYYLRVGARIDYGLRYYNYSIVKTVTVP